MIQDIYPQQFSNVFVATQGVQANDYVFHFKENTLLLKQNNAGFDLPKKRELEKCNGDGIFLFTLNQVNCFLVWDCSVTNSSEFSYHEVNGENTKSQKEIDWLSMLAFQLKTWYADNKFCGNCGTPTTIKTDERAISCLSCQIIKYPNVSPAIIVAIICENKILLASGVNFKKDFYSLVAGYVDIGETIEDTVVREVKEEVGIDIKNVRYYKSQPWPNSGSMMIGFIAEADDTQEIQIDTKEIVHAAWFTRGNLPNYPPQRSIAGEMIDKFERGDLE